MVEPLKGQRELPFVFGPFVRPDPAYEREDSSSQTEQSGYIPTEVQVERMIQAGLRLDIARKEEFDFPEGSEEDDEELVVDPTREPGYDLADASMDARALTARLRKQSAAAEKRKGADKPPEPPEAEKPKDPAGAGPKGS